MMGGGKGFAEEVGDGTAGEMNEILIYVEVPVWTDTEIGPLRRRLLKKVRIP